jgi:hypothetical protein
MKTPQMAHHYVLDSTTRKKFIQAKNRESEYLSPKLLDFYDETNYLCHKYNTQVNLLFHSSSLQQQPV